MLKAGLAVFRPASCIIWKNWAGCRKWNHRSQNRQPLFPLAAGRIHVGYKCKQAYIPLGFEDLIFWNWRN